MYYAMLFLSSFLFSSGFLCQKLYRNNCRDGIKRTIYLVLFTSIITFVSMFFIGGMKLALTPFSFLMAVIYAINNFVSTYAGIKAFKYADLSLYSMFMMMGSIVIPSVFGLIFYNEQITWLKAAAFVLIFASLYLNTAKSGGNTNKKASFYYLLVFTLNGTAGVISKIHQSMPEHNVPTESFLSLSAAIRMAVCIIIILIINQKDNTIVLTTKAVIYGFASGLLNAVGNYFNLFVLIFIPITVHSVITTGATLIFSAILGLLFKEKITKRTAAALLLALGATVLSAL